ncbi:MAG: hypothetical protein R2819_01280 [Allomuricauda sp.]
MKAIFFMFLSLMTFSKGLVDQESVVYATYDGYDSGVYSFIDDNGEMYDFSAIEETASQKYDLDSDEFIGKMFKVTYKIETDVDENEEEYDIYVIVDLELPM